MSSKNQTQLARQRIQQALGSQSSRLNLQGLDLREIPGEIQLFDPEEIKALVYLPKMGSLSLYKNLFPAAFNLLIEAPENLTALRAQFN